MDSNLIARTPLFAGLDSAALADIAGRMRPRAFAAREVICREGEDGTGLFVIVSGLAQVLRPHGGAAPADTYRRVTVARLGHGDVVGEMSLVTGEPRSATVVASVPTEVLELDRAVFLGLIADYPAIIKNLNGILSRRLARTTAQRPDRAERGEAVTLVLDRASAPLATRVIEATAATSPRPVLALDLTASLALASTTQAVPSVAAALAALDDALPRYGTVIVVADAGQADLLHLLEHTERTVALLAASGAGRMLALATQAGVQPELILLDDADERPDVADAAVLRRFSSDAGPGQIGWIGRHLARTKLGLALGAGGAKGYAHVATLRALEEAGYTVDCVAGSSIGAMVGAWMGLGRDAAAIERVMRESFTEELVRAMFKLSLSGLSSGLAVHARICRETTEERTFAELDLPLTVMAVDLDARQPVPLTAGPVWEALIAATALPGMFPPHQLGGRRFVDSLCLVPVPTAAARDAGADIVVAVNLLGRETLPAWPGEEQPAAAAPRSGVRMLDTLLEVMDLSQLDASERHAAQADVVVTPRFGPSTWRDFASADRFLAAGRAATLAQLSTLGTLARPQGKAIAIRRH